MSESVITPTGYRPFTFSLWIHQGPSWANLSINSSFSCTPARATQPQPWIIQPIWSSTRSICSHQAVSSGKMLDQGQLAIVQVLLALWCMSHSLSLYTNPKVSSALDQESSPSHQMVSTGVSLSFVRILMDLYWIQTHLTLSLPDQYKKVVR